MPEEEVVKKDPAEEFREAGMRILTAENLQVEDIEQYNGVVQEWFEYRTRTLPKEPAAEKA